MELPVATNPDFPNPGASQPSDGVDSEGEETSQQPAFAELDSTVPELDRDIYEACGFTGGKETTKGQVMCIVPLTRIRDFRRWMRSNVPDVAYGPNSRAPQPMAAAAPADPSCPLFSKTKRGHLLNGAPKLCLAARKDLQARGSCEAQQYQKDTARLKKATETPLYKNGLALERQIKAECSGRQEPGTPLFEKCQTLRAKHKRLEAQAEREFRISALIASIRKLEKALAEDSKLLAQAKCDETFGGKVPRKPTAAECSTALKILKKYRSLAPKLGSKLSEQRLRELDRLRDSGQLRISHLPGSFQSQWPSVFDNLTLAEIETICRHLR